MRLPGSVRMKLPRKVSMYCPKCGKQLLIKWGRHGRFLSCSGFPDCRFSKAFPNYKDDLEEVKKLYSELGSYVILPLRLTELATK
mgnify:CR=1 FL=1